MGSTENSTPNAADGHRVEQRSEGVAFYTPGRDVVAWLLSGVSLAVLVGYGAMLVAWAAAEHAGA